MWIEVGVILGFMTLLFIPLFWILTDIKADLREIRNQVYNHIPTQINEIKDKLTTIENKSKDKQ